MMQYLITMPMLLFATVILGCLLATIKIRGVELGTAMVMFAGVLVSCLAGVYAWSLSEGHPMYERTYALLNASIVPSSLQDLFNLIFLTCVGLLASKNLIPIMKRYGTRFLAMAVVITTLGFAGTVAAGKLTGRYTAFEMAGVFSGALTSTPGIMASLSSSREAALEQMEGFASLSEAERRYIEGAAGRPSEGGTFGDEQRERYQKHAETATGIGYTVTYPFGSLLVIVLVNLLPFLFRLDVDEERRRYATEMEALAADSPESSGARKGVLFSTLSFFVIFLVGQFVGTLKLGSLSLTPTAGVLIASLILGARRKVLGLDFSMDEDVLKAIEDLGICGLLACIGLRLGYNAMATIRAIHVWLILYATIIGVAAMALGFVVGRYLLKLNWMILCGALCGGMTNTSGLSIAISVCKSDHPSIGYAASYPFAVVMMVLYNLALQNMHFLR